MTGKYRWVAALAAVVVVIAAVVMLAGLAPSQGAGPVQVGPPVTPPPVPTPVILGDPTGLIAAPGDNAGEVSLGWVPAANATVHWVWSAGWDNTGGKWTLGGYAAATVSGLQAGQDYWFIVIAGREAVGKATRWSEWSNWAKAKAGAAAQPTPTSTPPAAAPETTNLQIVCINRTLRPCELIRNFYAPRVNQRTNGEVAIEIYSYPELGLDGRDAIRLVNDNTLEFAEIYSGYVSGDLPIIDVGNLLGLSPSNDVHLALTDAIAEDMMRILREATGGEPVFRSYYPGQYIFSREPLPDLAAYEDKKIRQHGSTILDDLLTGLGAEGQFVHFADVYTALERGVIDSAVSCSSCGHGQRWYEVADYLYGPFPGSIGVTYLTMNGEQWAALTPENRAIIKAVGKEYEAENLRLLKDEWEPYDIMQNVGAGMTYSDFPDDVKEGIRRAAIESVIPNWVERVGGPGAEAVRLFNEVIAPIVKVRINPDGSATATE